MLLRSCIEIFPGASMYRLAACYAPGIYFFAIAHGIVSGVGADVFLQLSAELPYERLDQSLDRRHPRSPNCRLRLQQARWSSLHCINQSHRNQPIALRQSIAQQTNAAIAIRAAATSADDLDDESLRRKSQHMQLSFFLPPGANDFFVVVRWSVQCMILFGQSHTRDCSWT